MAPRIKIRQTEETRAKIQTSLLINRLQDYAYGKISLEPGQVSAIKTLLGKTLPDLSAVEMNAQTDNKHHVISEKPLTENEWKDAYSMGTTTGSPTRPN